jgi:hypothetical protein
VCGSSVIVFASGNRTEGRVKEPVNRVQCLFLSSDKDLESLFYRIWAKGLEIGIGRLFSYENGRVTVREGRGVRNMGRDRVLVSGEKGIGKEQLISTSRLFSLFFLFRNMLSPCWMGLEGRTGQDIHSTISSTLDKCWAMIRISAILWKSWIISSTRYTAR